MRFIDFRKLAVLGGFVSLLFRVGRCGVCGWHKAEIRAKLAVFGDFPWLALVFWIL